MNTLKKNIFLTGAPSSGKTTVIKKVIERLDHPATGFYTQEERIAGKRVGFMMETIDGKKCHLAHQDIKSDFHIKRYGVSIENIDSVAVPSIAPRDDYIIVIDEIGKMECLSGVFKKAVTEDLDSANIVVGTITLGGDDFILNIKSRDDMEIQEVTLENRDSLPGLIVKKVSELLRAGSEEEQKMKRGEAALVRLPSLFITTVLVLCPCEVLACRVCIIYFHYDTCRRECVSELTGSKGIGAVS